MSSHAWLNRLIDWELELRYQITKRICGELPPKPTPTRIVDKTFMEDAMPLGVQDEIEMAAFSEHRGHHSIAEDYRVCAGYGGLHR